MKRLIVTIILAILAIAIAGCDFTYHEVGYHHGHGHGAVIVTRPVHWGRHYGHHGHRGHGHGNHPGRHWRRH
ncbi:MAG: hypothetical protein ACYTBS_16375 [Planctomycetota bacterium]